MNKLNIPLFLVVFLLLISTLLAGCINSNVVDETSSSDLTADFTFTPDNPSMVSIIQFKSLSDDKINHRWDFGDGETSFGITPTHRYLKAGTFNVSLSVYDYESGKNASCTKTITVVEKENASVPNKWAILCTYYKPWDNRYQGHISTVKNVLMQKMNIPNYHVFKLYNDSFNKINILKLLSTIKNSSLDWNNSEIIICTISHGGSTPLAIHPNGMSMKDGTPIHSFLVKQPSNSQIVKDSEVLLWDYEFKEILDNHTLPSQKVLVVISACDSGNFAAQDTTGIMYGKTDHLYISCGGANRIVVTLTTSPSAGYENSQAQHFWQEGLAEGKGDTNSINGNEDGQTSVEEAWFYYKSCVDDFLVTAAQPCMNDQYPADNPEDEMFL